MAPTLASHARNFKPITLVALAVAGAIGIGFGCGGGNATSGTGASSGSHANSAGSGHGGEGGVLFGNSSSGDVGSTGSTGGSKPVCDGNPTTGPFQWEQNSVDANGQYGLAVATDAQGNVVVAGAYSGTLTIGSLAPLPSATNSSIFVAKFGPNGSPLWARGFVPTAFSGLLPAPVGAGRAITVDSQGNVYVAGDFTGSFTFGSQTMKSQGNFFGDAFLLQLNPMGTPVTGLILGDPSSTPTNMGGTQTVHALATHKGAAGEVIALVGEFEKVLDLSGGAGTTLINASASTPAAYVAVLTTTFTPVFGVALGDGTITQSGRGVVFDASGDLFVTGNSAGTVNFPGGKTLTPTGAQGAFVGQIKGDGSTSAWAKVFGAGTASGEGIALDATGDVFVAGDHQGSIDFGGGALDNMFGANVFVAKLDASGGHVWSHTYGDSMAQHAHGIAVDAMGRAFVAGEYNSAIDFGGGALMSAGSVDIFLAKLDTHGCQVWAKTIGDSMLQKATGVAVDPMGNAVITGNIAGTVTFGTSPVIAVGDDVFAAKFGP